MDREIAVLSILSTLYLLMAVGAYLIYSDFIMSVVSRVKMHRRLDARRREMEDEHYIFVILRRYLIMVTGYSVSPQSFLLLISIVFLTVLLTGLRTLGCAFAALISLSAASIPCLLLWIRTCSIKRKGSYEGEQLVSEFLREYRINNFNIYETLDKISCSTADIKITSGLLSKLLYKLRSTGDPACIKAATDDFAYSIGTNWSMMLAHDICIAAQKGTNISFAVEDILIQLREARTMTEERKRLNSEAARMAFYMVPVIYFVTIFMAIKFLDIPAVKLLQNQFGTAEGILLLFFIAFLFIVNIALIQLITNRSFDY